MLAVEGDEQLVLQQRGRRDAVGRRQTGRIVADHGEVELPLREALHQRGAAAFDRDDRDVRPGPPELPQGGGHQRDVRGRESSHTEHPAVARVDHGQLLLRPRQTVQYVHGVASQRPTRGIQPYSTGEPVEQRPTCLLFQGGDPPGHRGLRVVEPDRGAGERPGVGHGHQQTQRVDLEHIASSASPEHIPSAHGFHAIQSLVECPAPS